MNEDAVYLAIIEATKCLSPDLRGRHPEEAYRRAAGLREVLIHNYIGVDLTIVWNATQESLPEIKHDIDVILSEETHS